MRDKVILGTAPIGKLLMKLSIPAIVAQLVNLLYNLVDRIYIGHLPVDGDIALSGLGLCFPIIMIISAFANLIGGGSALRMAILMGKNDNEGAERIMGTSFASLIALSVTLTLVVQIFAEPLLYAFGASRDTLPYALSYLRIYSAGTIFVMLALGLNPCITTQGFSKISMLTVIIGAVCNIILDPIFIFVFDMGVSGAALATIISQSVSAAWVIAFLFGKKTVLKIRRVFIRINVRVLLPTIGLGVSPFIMTATESAINICFNSSLSLYGGDVAVGAMTILTSVMQLMMLPVQGLSQGAQPIMSYNYGAGNFERVKKTFKLLLISCLGYTLTFWVFVQCFPEFFIHIFNSEEQLVSMAKWALRLYLGTMGLFGIQMAIQQTFVSLGKAKQSLVIACLRKVILLIPLIYILPNITLPFSLPAEINPKVFAVLLAEPVSDLISVTAASVLFAVSYKKMLLPSNKVK